MKNPHKISNKKNNKTKQGNKKTKRNNNQGLDNKHQEESSELEELIKEKDGPVEKKSVKIEESEKKISQNEFIEKLEFPLESNTPVLRRIDEIPSINFLNDLDKENPSESPPQKSNVNYEPINYIDDVYESEKKQLNENFNFIVKKAEKIIPSDTFEPKSFFQKKKIDFEINPELTEIQKQNTPGLIEDYYSSKYEKFERDKIKLPFEENNKKYKPMR